MPPSSEKPKTPLPKPAPTNLQASLAQAQLCHHLSTQIITTACALYAVPSARSDLAILFSNTLTGTVIAQVVLQHAEGTRVLLEEEGGKLGSDNARIEALQNLLDAVEGLWSLLCTEARGKMDGDKEKTKGKGKKGEAERRNYFVEPALKAERVKGKK